MNNEWLRRSKWEIVWWMPTLFSVHWQSCMSRWLHRGLNFIVSFREWFNFYINSFVYPSYLTYGLDHANCQLPIANQSPAPLVSLIISPKWENIHNKKEQTNKQKSNSKIHSYTPSKCMCTSLSLVGWIRHFESQSNSFFVLVSHTSFLSFSY